MQGYLALGSQTSEGPEGEIQGIHELGWEKLHLHSHEHLLEISYFLPLQIPSIDATSIFIPGCN